MHKITLYIDESGKSSLRSDESEPFIVTGVIIKRRDLEIIEGFFRFIKTKYGINTNAPFHSYDIFECPKYKLKDGVLRNLAKDLGDFISMIPIKIQILQINKKVFKNALGVKSFDDFKGSLRREQMKDFPYRIMFAYFLAWFTVDLGKNTIGEIIADSRRGADKNLIDALDESISPKSVLNSDVKLKIKNNCTALIFAKKTYLSAALELADFISYTSFFKARRKLSEVSNIGLDKAWRKIKKVISNQDIRELSKEEVQEYFKVESDGVHKFLKDNI